MSVIDAGSKNRGLWRTLSLTAVVIVLIGLVGYDVLTIPNLEDQNHSLSTENQSLTAQNQELQAGQQETNAQLSALSNELSILNSTARSDEALAASLATESSVVVRLQSQLQAADSNISALASLVNRLRLAENATVTNLQAELASAKENYSNVSSEAAMLSTQVSQLQSEVLQLESEITELQSEITHSGGEGPALIQESGSTCSYFCGGSTTATFIQPVKSGDMLVLTVVVDNLTALEITDTLNTTIKQAVSTTNLPPTCGEDFFPPYCRAIIYWGIFNSSGQDSVTVSDSPSMYAIRLQIWEFSGVNSVASSVSCTPTCAAVAYPAGSVLIATARGNVSGGGAGFSFYQCVASYLAGSEYQIAAVAGSTAFPFSPAVSEVESAAVLVEASP